MSRPAADHDARIAAARLLRAARSPHGDAEDAVEWAFALIPDSPAARRLKIELLLAHGDLDAADALIAQGLLRRPTDPALCHQRARSLLARGDLRQANAELRLVLARRPAHLGSLELAGRVALRLGHARRAVTLLERAEQRAVGTAHRHGPAADLDGIRARLVAAWLAAGRPGEARRALARMADPPARLRARVLAGEGRLLEATEVLERACRTAEAPKRGPAMRTLIDLLEDTGDLRRLRTVLSSLDASDPATLARAGQSWLSMGAFRLAIVRMNRLLRRRGHRGTALVVIMVAAAMLGRRGLADRALARLRRLDEPIEPRTVADAWGRGLLGRLLLDQRSARKAGSDPHTDRLQQLLGEAAGVFEDALAGGCPDARDLRQHLAVCRRESMTTAA